MFQELWIHSRLAPEYEVSNYGRIRWYDNKKWASIHTLNGYQIVNRSIKYTESGKQDIIYVHRLVAYEFIEGYKDGYVVDHIDGCKTNNFANNLRWVDKATNVKDCYNPQKKYNQEYIDNLYNDYRINNLSGKDIGKKYNIQQCYVSKLMLNNLSSKDKEPIKYLYNNNLYSIQELSRIYNVNIKVIEDIIKE